MSLELGQELGQEMRQGKEIDYRMVLKAMSVDEKKELMVLTNHHGLLMLSAHFCLIAILVYGQSVSEGLCGSVFLLVKGL